MFKQTEPLLRRQIENTERLRSALVKREFVLHFQPILNFRTGELVSVEALIRWMHPERGLLAPLEFLPAIEGSELSIELGEWIIDSVLSQSEQWSAQGLSLSIAVNVSAFHLQKTDFTARLQEMLAKHPTVSPSSLIIEILETSALEDLNHVSRVIEDCQMLGVQFALDDFGTGYSSLTYLRRLEVDKLKIDRSFVHGMLDDAGALAIADGVIGLSRAFKCDVIAEGIESEEQKALLLKLGCCIGQGYLISKPMPASEVLRWNAGRMPIEISKNQEIIARSGLPLIYASVEHRTWINAMEEHLRGIRRYPPPMDKHQCNLGRWLDSEGKRQYGANPLFDALLISHSRVHETAGEMMELQRQGANAQAINMLPKIKTIRDELLQCLDSLSAIESIQ